MLTLRIYQNLVKKNPRFKDKNCNRNSNQTSVPSYVRITKTKTKNTKKKKQFFKVSS